MFTDVSVLCSCSHKLADAKTRKVMGRDEFRLLHYAGEVNYNVNGVCVLLINLLTLNQLSHVCNCKQADEALQQGQYDLMSLEVWCRTSDMQNYFFLNFNWSHQRILSNNN